MIIRKQDHELHGIAIKPYEDDSKEQVTYDLHLSDEYLLPGGTKKSLFSNSFRLRPGHCIVVLSKERLTIPNNVFGVLCSKGKLTQQGLMVPNTKVDPKFDGYLKVAIFNSGNQPIIVERGQAFCSIFFATLEKPVLTNENRLAPDTHAARSNPFVNFVQRYSTSIATITLSTTGAFLAAYTGAVARPPALSTNGSGLMGIMSQNGAHIVTIVLSALCAFAATYAVMVFDRRRRP